MNLISCGKILIRKVYPSNFFLVMKLTTFFLMIAILQVSAKGYSQKINYSGTNLRVEKVLKEIEKQTGFYLFYKYNELKDAKLIDNLDLRNVELTQALSEVFKDQPYEYLFKENTIIINKKGKLKTNNQMMVQKAVLEVKGIVNDKQGEPLPGASVKVKNESLATMTDGNGNFTLKNMPDNAVLLVSYTGFKTVEISVGTTNFLNIVLEYDQAKLDEIVVVGYGTQKKKDVTGSVSSVPSERLDMVPNVNIAQAIQGAVPGVVIQQSTGGSNPQSSIMIRGRNSILASNNPLIILDGIAYNGELSDINVNDVKSIEVLKDASSAAIYGSRGANGVIIVTTKTGVAGEKAKISYDGKYSIQQANNMPKFMSPEQFYQFKEIREPGNVSTSEQKIYDDKSWTDWSDLALRDGSGNHHNLSVSGANGGTNYYLSGNYLKVDGQTINDSYERINGNISLQSRINDYVKIGTNTQLTSADFGGAPISWEDVLRVNPLTQGFNEDGTLKMYPWPEFTDISNPLEPLNYDYQKKTFQILSNNFLEVEIPKVKGLSYRLNFGIQKYWFDQSNYKDRSTVEGFAKQGYYNAENREKNYVSVENIINYNKRFDKHSFDFTGVYSYEKYKHDMSYLEASGFPNDFIGKYSIGQATYSLPTYDYLQTILSSQMLRVNYNYDSRYLLTITGRRDGFSGFGENKKWGIFPSVALGWNIAEEQFGLKETFDELKLRVSYGLNGNQAVGAYETISRLSENNIVNGPTSLPGYVPSKLGQDELGWESSRTFNFGLDFKLKKLALSGSVNVYNTDTYDLLLNRTISPVHGIPSITQNIGKTNNKGLEAILNFNAFNKENFGWFISGNIAVNKNKIVSLYGLKDENGKEIDDLANQWFIGQPIAVNYDWKFIGVWQQNEAVEAAKYNYTPGTAKFLDVNNDYQRSTEDRVFIGQSDPKLTWGLTNTFRHKNLSLTVFMHGVHGVTRLNNLLQDASSSSGVRRNVMAKNWWTETNPTNEYFANHPTAITLPIYENASFIRLKDITLSYTLSDKYFKKIGVNNLRVYMNLRNMATITDWKTNDPELSFGRGAAPLAKEYVFGLNFNF